MPNEARALIRNVRGTGDTQHKVTDRIMETGVNTNRFSETHLCKGIAKAISVMRVTTDVGMVVGTTAAGAGRGSTN